MRRSENLDIIMVKNYTHNELLDTLQNLTGKKPTQQLIANAIGCDLSRINKRAGRNSKYSNEELIKIGNYFNVNLVDDNTKKDVLSNYNSMYDNFFSADYFPDEFCLFLNGKFSFSENKIPVYITKSLVKSYSPSKSYYVINAYGDSMNPEIKNGDKLIIESTGKETFKDNHVYVFLYNGQIFVKRLIFNVEQIVIKSDNLDPVYKTSFIRQSDKKQLNILGRVVGIMRELI